MFQALTKHLKQLFHTPALFSYSMEKVAQIGSSSLFVRKGDPLTQEAMDYMATHKVYLDGRESDHIMCLLPRVHNMYFELRIEGENPTRIGFVNNYVDCSKGLEEGISSYVEKVLAPKIQKKLDSYKLLCPEKEA